ncbi:MAG: tyrosine-type recombinase/integrase, partial [Gammaproteobacteria bacterium]|nr:tyrosine-type recombinase/integrase [Gammaproteobacteria bacterium]
APFRPDDIPPQVWAPIPAPPELVRAFIDYYSPASDDQLERGDRLTKSLEPRAPATVRRCLATVSKAHRLHCLEDPTKDELVRDAAKEFFRGRGDQKQAAPILWDDIARFNALEWADLQRFFETTEDQTIADQVRLALRGPKQLTRAKAMLLIGYNTMARREELVAFDVSDIPLTNDAEGVAKIRKGKTDQAGEGQVRYLSAPALNALRAWLKVSGITEGPLFTQFQRNGQARLRDPRASRARKGEAPSLLTYGKRISANEVNKTFKAAMLFIGKTPVEVQNISGHSTRVGASQDMLSDGCDIGEIMRSGGWKDAKMPARYTKNQQAKQSGMAKMMREKLGRGRSK